MTTELVLGPILRRVVGGSATIWVQTSHPGTVVVTAGAAAGRATTFTAHGRHFALVRVDGLTGRTPYTVSLDGESVWPVAGDERPAPVIAASGGPSARLVFGSCRHLGLGTTDLTDALDAYARRLAHDPKTQWPDSLVLLGDQVYADQATTFDDYAKLYESSWAKPAVRWLLSTVPSLMIFDDHEIVDDWNTSLHWRETYTARPGWPAQISAGLGSYWVYQHLGNLAPDELAADPVLNMVRDNAVDASVVLDAFGLRADTARDWYRWSVAADFGRTRVIVVDNRAGRVVEGDREMLNEPTWQWLVDQANTGDIDHVVIGTSLPWLLAPSLHNLEAWNTYRADQEADVARRDEKIRQWLDLEHWAAFPKSFARLSQWLDSLSHKDLGSIAVISGDVHHSYAVRAELGDPRTPIHQIVCSPLRQLLNRWTAWQLRLAWQRPMRALSTPMVRRAARPGGVRRWRRIGKVNYRNTIGTLEYTDKKQARAVLEGTNGNGTLHTLLSLRLTAR